MYVYGPCEPLAVPVQPGDDMGDQVRWISLADLYTQGRCGQCGACPKVWKLEVNASAGDFVLLNGTFYLHRDQYSYRGVFTENFSSLCSWRQKTPEPIVGASQESGDVAGGWQLTFERPPESIKTWFLRTPVFGTQSQLSSCIYRFASDPQYWQCLGPNVFAFYGSDSEFGIDGAPPFLSIEPFFA